MNVPHISFKKLPIMTYMEETYYLYHRQIFGAIKELLSNKEILDNCTCNFKPLYHESQRIYSEQYTEMWWERVQESLPEDAKVSSIILYSDATTCDHLGKTSKHPIYLTLDNIVSWCRNKPNAKVLLGYLLILKVKSIPKKDLKA